MRAPALRRSLPLKLKANYLVVKSVSGELLQAFSRWLRFFGLDNRKILAGFRAAGAVSRRQALAATNCYRRCGAHPMAHTARRGRFCLR